MFIRNSSTPLHNFCPFFYLFLLSFFLLIWRKSLNHLNTSPLSVICWTSGLCHPAMTSVSTSLLWTRISNCLLENSTWASHRYLKLNLSIKDQQLLPSNLPFLLGPPANFQVWNLSISFDDYYFWLPFHSWANPIANPDKSPCGVLLKLFTPLHFTWSHCLLASISATFYTSSGPSCTPIFQPAHPFSTLQRHWGPRDLVKGAVSLS